MESEPEGSRVLIFWCAGKSDPKDVVYKWENGEKSSPTKFSVVSIVEHLLQTERYPKDTVFVAIFHTQQSLKNAQGVEITLQQQGIPSKLVKIRDGTQREEQEEIFEKAQELIRPNDEVILDITGSLRHIPFLLSSAITYASVVNGAHLKEIYYGAFELGEVIDNVTHAPLIPCKRWFDQVEWFSIVRAARESTHWKPLATFAEKRLSKASQEGKGSVDVSRLKDALKRMSSPLGQALPLEAGIEGGRLLKTVEEISPEGVGAREIRALPEIRALKDFLKEEVQSWAIREEVGDKKDIKLTKEELERELNFVRYLVEKEEYGQACMILREWIINFVLHVEREERWLDVNLRRKMEERLNGWSKRLEILGKNSLGPLEVDCAKLWDSVADQRNFFMHGGFREEGVPREKFEELCTRAQGLLNNPSSLTLRKGRVLVTPVGMRPGAAYTAALEARPSFLLCIVSKETEPKAQEARKAIEKEQGSLEKFEILPLADPHGGIEEVRKKLERGPPEIVASSEEVVINPTGGTSLMGILCMRIGEEAKRLGLRVRMGIASDRRGEENQAKDPFVKGDWIWLDE